MTHLALLLLLLCADAGAEIYRSQDAQGRPVFSDRPSENSQPVVLDELNTTPSIDVPDAPPLQGKVVSEDTPQLSISQPREGQILPNGLQATTVALSLSKPLPPGYRLAISLDGKTLQTGTATQLSIPRLNRGRHQISATLLDAKGQAQDRDTVEIMVYWPN